MSDILITSSIVIYHNKEGSLRKAINSILNTRLNILLFLIDNSTNDSAKNIVKDERIKYIFTGNNIGFGCGHNIAIKKALEVGSAFHIVLNPDVYFGRGVIEGILDYMISNPDIGLLMPMVLNPDNTTQYLPKLLPTPGSLLRRIIPMPRKIHQYLVNNYELRWINHKKIHQTPIISGCFSFFKTEVFKKIGLYDRRFFMYFEDFDISRRVARHYKTIFYPLEHVYHEYGRGARKSYKLFMIYVRSAVKYFNKWGWFIDKYRSIKNKETLEKIKRQYV